MVIIYYYYDYAGRAPPMASCKRFPGPRPGALGKTYPGAGIPALDAGKSASAIRSAAATRKVGYGHKIGCGHKEVHTAKVGWFPAKPARVTCHHGALFAGGATLPGQAFEASVPKNQKTTEGSPLSGPAKPCHAARTSGEEHACDACARTTSLATFRLEAIGGSRRETASVSSSSQALEASAFVPYSLGVLPAGSFVRDTDARTGAKAEPGSSPGPATPRARAAGAPAGLGLSGTVAVTAHLGGRVAKGQPRFVLSRGLGMPTIL